MRQLKPALFIPHGPGKSAFDVSEEFALHQPFRQGPAIQRHKRAVVPPALAVDGGGHQLLARAGLPGDQYRIVMLRHLLNLPVDLHHLGVPPDNAGKPGCFLRPDFQAHQTGDVTHRGENPHQAPFSIRHAHHRHLDLFGLTGLGDNIERIVEVGPGIRRLPAKRTLIAAKGPPESLVTVPAQNLLPGITGQGFRRPVEADDAPLPVMADDPIRQVVQNLLQVLLILAGMFPKFGRPCANLAMMGIEPQDSVSFKQYQILVLAGSRVQRLPGPRQGQMAAQINAIWRYVTAFSPGGCPWTPVKKGLTACGG